MAEPSEWLRTSMHPQQYPLLRLGKPKIQQKGGLPFEGNGKMLTPCELRSVHEPAHLEILSRLYNRRSNFNCDFHHWTILKAAESPIFRLDETNCGAKKSERRWMSTRRCLPHSSDPAASSSRDKLFL
ncbi:hypothetical protein RSAG8_04113, partial [Rhizoctonia solani AG-8 WAC10335]